MKSKGPRIEPWGTPADFGLLVENILFTLVFEICQLNN